MKLKQKNEENLSFIALSLYNLALIAHDAPKSVK